MKKCTLGINYGQMAFLQYQLLQVSVRHKKQIISSIRVQPII